MGGIIRLENAVKEFSPLVMVRFNIGRQRKDGQAFKARVGTPAVRFMSSIPFPDASNRKDRNTSPVNIFNCNYPFDFISDCNLYFCTFKNR